MNSRALTQLTAEEEMFRDAVRDFARSEIGPRVKEMDVREKFDPGLLRQFFELNLMGIQIPQEWGGADGSFFMSVLAVEELSRVDPSAAVIVDVQNTLVNNALLNWGNQAQKSRYLPRLATGSVGAYALSEAVAGSDAFALRT
ncbi:MAG: acyl-CoA dehydrogenase, partial [Acidobacteria bacterium]|nr:acyl-CoA dehydrogenase [Acidobacteriota bacterium]